MDDHNYCIVTCVASISVGLGEQFSGGISASENPVPRSFCAPKPQGNACYVD